jgi:FkbM family methyltransferase
MLWLAIASTIGLRIKEVLPGGLRRRALPMWVDLGGRRQIYWVRDRSHIANLDEIWRRGEYETIRGRDFDVIVDLGANVGSATLFLHRRFPTARLIAVEPDHRNVELLRRNLRGIDVTLVQAAVGADPGIVSFAQSDQATGSRVARSSEADAAHDLVPVVRVDTMLLQASVPPNARILIKIDIEGSEWEVLREGGLGITPIEVYGETHAYLAPPAPKRFLEEAASSIGLRSVGREGRLHFRPE